MRQRGPRAAHPSAKRPWLAVTAVVVLVAVVGVSLVHHFAPFAASKAPGRERAGTLSSLRVLQVTPATGTKNVPFGADIIIRFSRAPSTGTPLPSIEPDVAGSWSRPTSSELVFHPAGSFVPYTPYRVTIPLESHAQLVDTKGGGGTGGHGAGTVESSFTVRPASTLRLQQLLAELGYLPLSFQPFGLDSQASGSALSNEPLSPSLVSPAPQRGSFQWMYAATPSELQSLWSPGNWTVLTQGAVMAFESQHGLTVDGIPGPYVWRDLLEAVAARDAAAAPYHFLLVTERLPETLEVWSEGRIVLTTVANTGAPGAATPLGAWTVFLRLRSATMTGTNPNGTHYVDHGVPDVAYFHGSDAVHGFLRASYGFPQSNGCVEVPLDVADLVYSLDPLGTVVDVTDAVLDA